MLLLYLRRCRRLLASLPQRDALGRKDLVLALASFLGSDHDAVLVEATAAASCGHPHLLLLLGRRRSLLDYFSARPAEACATGLLGFLGHLEVVDFLPSAHRLLLALLHHPLVVLIVPDRPGAVLLDLRLQHSLGLRILRAEVLLKTGGLRYSFYEF